MRYFRLRRFGSVPAALLLSLALGAPSLAQTPAAARPPSMADAIAAIRSYAPQAMAAQGTPGLSLAITDRAKTLAVITLGYANVDARAPVTPETRFAIGSITKSMTALALLQLHDAGKIDLDAPVQRYLPWFSLGSGGGSILVHQLLSHTAGIPDDFSAANDYLYDVVALQAAKPLFAPGTSWSYSNDGYATVGAILSRLDGRPWSQSVQSRVFDALGMTESSPFFTPDTMTTAALGYQFRDNDRPAPLHPPLVASPPMDFVDPAGSVLSTPEDMARYMRFYLDDGKTADGTQLISPATFAAMTSPDRLTNGKPAGSAGVMLAEAPAFYKQYGYGFSIFHDGGDRLIGHTGGISGYTACMQMNLTRGFGAIGMANLVEAPLHPCAIVLYAMAVLRAQGLGQPLPQPPPPVDPAYVANAGDYPGTYAQRNGSALTITARGGHLFLADGARTIALYPRGTDLFWADDPNYATFHLVFGRDKSNQVVEMTYGPRWYPNERYRGPRAFRHPAAWDALAGRYENTYFGQPAITRVVIVKNRLTLDGTDPLKPLGNGRFALGSSIVSFDTYAGDQPQRLTIDDTHLYRTELP